MVELGAWLSDGRESGFEGFLFGERVGGGKMRWRPLYIEKVSVSVGYYSPANATFSRTFKIS